MRWEVQAPLRCSSQACVELLLAEPGWARGESTANTPAAGAEGPWQARLLSGYSGPFACVLPGSIKQAQQATLRFWQFGGAGRCSRPHQRPLRTLNPPLLSEMVLESLQQQRHALNWGLNTHARFASSDCQPHTVRWAHSRLRCGWAREAPHRRVDSASGSLQPSTWAGGQHACWARPRGTPGCTLTKEGARGRPLCSLTHPKFFGHTVRRPCGWAQPKGSNHNRRVCCNAPTAPASWAGGAVVQIRQCVRVFQHPHSRTPLLLEAHRRHV